jgi:hypothetical protein
VPYLRLSSQLSWECPINLLALCFPSLTRLPTSLHALPPPLPPPDSPAHCRMWIRKFPCYTWTIKVLFLDIYEPFRACTLGWRRGEGVCNVHAPLAGGGGCVYMHQAWLASTPTVYTVLYYIVQAHKDPWWVHSRWKPLLSTVQEWSRRETVDVKRVLLTI